MQGRVEIPANPEFGCSTHVAETILATMSFDSSIHGGLNLRTSSELIDRATKTGYNPVEFNADREDRQEQLATTIEHSIDNGDGVPLLLYHAGAHGIEPVTYVLETSASEAVATVETIVTT